MADPIPWTNELGQRRWQPVRSDGSRAFHGAFEGTYVWGRPGATSWNVALFRWRWQARWVAWRHDRSRARRAWRREIGGDDEYE